MQQRNDVGILRIIVTLQCILQRYPNHEKNLNDFTSKKKISHVERIEDCIFETNYLFFLFKKKHQTKILHLNILLENFQKQTHAKTKTSQKP